jgi:DNA-binding MarR family transcriptional regulator
MGRPFHPELGLNRQLLLYLRRNPGATPGTLARVLGYDGAVVRDAVARLIDAELVAEVPDGRLRRCYLTEAGGKVLRRRTRRSPNRRTAVHS